MKSPTHPRALRVPPRRRRAAPVGLEWRCIRDGPREGARNMALDHALARCTARGTGVLRVYSWSRPTVSFGRNEPAIGRYSPRAAEELGIDCVRRPTGGRAVLHADEVTYSIAAPSGALGSARAAYRLVNAALAEAIGSLGAAVSVSSGARVPALDAGPCFQEPADSEVVAEGRKLVGSAQARIEGALLQHGSIIVSGDQSVLGELSRTPVPHAVPATLRSVLGEVSVDDLASNLRTALSSTLGGMWSPSEYTAVELEEADRLERERYARDSWTWRR